MFTVLYRWKVRPGMEEQFIEAWSAVTAYYRENSGSYGSRLHRGPDGIFYGYAQWPSAAARAEAFQSVPSLEASERLRAAIQERLPELELEIVADFLILPKK